MYATGVADRDIRAWQGGGGGGGGGSHIDE